jgi:PIN domain nuclease of toxin-antitoxin system
MLDTPSARGALPLPDARPALHRDPFDRMLVGQALEKGLVLMTRDPLVEQNAVSTMIA